MSAALALNSLAVKADFPILNRLVNDRPLVYLDSASTSQKPQVVLDSMQDHYTSTNANVHRGAYFLSDKASRAMEGARNKVARFIGAGCAEEIVFTKNATESLNLIAGAWGRANLGPGDVVVLSLLEHHANIVPWQMLAAERGIELRFLPLTKEGLLDLSDLQRTIDGAKLVSVTAMSNVTGALVPVETIAEAAHAAGALCAVDACQLAPHMAMNVRHLNIDFAAFSGHKMCGPTGVGVLWARLPILQEMPPFLGGGGMIANVTVEGFTAGDVPAKFEAGTPPIAEIVGLGAAVDYLDGIGMDAVRQHEIELSTYFLSTMRGHHGDNIVIHGPSEATQRGGVFSFAYKNVHPHDLSQILDEAGVNVRAGHHCAKPLMKELGVGATARASLYIYNTKTDIDQLAAALDRAAMFAL